MTEEKEIQQWIDRIEGGWPDWDFVKQEDKDELLKLLQRMKSDRIKINLISRNNAKLAGINIDQVDIKGLKELLGETWTNGDRIRAMTNKQMAEEIEEIAGGHCDRCPVNKIENGNCTTIADDCETVIIKWLESEVKG